MAIPRARQNARFSARLDVLIRQGPRPLVDMVEAVGFQPLVEMVKAAGLQLLIGQSPRPVRHGSSDTARGLDPKRTEHLPQSSPPSPACGCSNPSLAFAGNCVPFVAQA